LDAVDRATAGRPLWLRHRSGHLSLLNGAALRELGWWEADPPLGRMERSGGRPTGVTYGLEALVGEWSRARQAPPSEQDLASTGAEMLRLGITAFADLTPSNRAEHLPLWVGQHAVGSIPQRVSLWVSADSLAGRGRAPTTEPVRLGGIKVMLEPGANDAPSPETLAAVFRQAARGAWPVAVHAVEADAVAAVLEALRVSRRHPPHVAPQLRIEHAHLLPPALVAELHHEWVPACVQPAMLWELGDVYAATLPREQWAWLLPLRTLASAALPLAIGSDAPAAPLSPLRHVAAAVTRRDAGGREWNPGERIGVARALTAITRGAARLAGFGASSGELRPGMSADAVYFRESWLGLRAALEAGELPVPAGTLIAGRWHAWNSLAAPVR
jgi:hypothetical protein